MKKLSLLFSIIFFSSLAQAEYRVFVLHLENKKNNLTRQIQTTLDPEQYASFYPLGPNEIMTYVQTWRCPGRTDFFKPHCPSPIKN